MIYNNLSLNYYAFKSKSVAERTHFFAFLVLLEYFYPYTFATRLASSTPWNGRLPCDP